MLFCSLQARHRVRFSDLWCPYSTVWVSPFFHQISYSKPKEKEIYYQLRKRRRWGWKTNKPLKTQIKHGNVIIHQTWEKQYLLQLFVTWGKFSTTEWWELKQLPNPKQRSASRSPSNSLEKQRERAHCTVPPGREQNCAYVPRNEAKVISKLRNGTELNISMEFRVKSAYTLKNYYMVHIITFLRSFLPLLIAKLRKSDSAHWLCTESRKRTNCPLLGAPGMPAWPCIYRKYPIRLSVCRKQTCIGICSLVTMYVCGWIC